MRGDLDSLDHFFPHLPDSGVRLLKLMLIRNTSLSVLITETPCKEEKLQIYLKYCTSLSTRREKRQVTVCEISHRCSTDHMRTVSNAVIG